MYSKEWVRMSVVLSHYSYAKLNDLCYEHGISKSKAMHIILTDYLRAWDREERALPIFPKYVRKDAPPARG